MESGWKQRKEGRSLWRDAHSVMSEQLSDRKAAELTLTSEDT